MTSKKPPTYQSLSQELDEITMRLQDDSISVDDAVKAYERGMEVIKTLQAQLETAENKVKQIKANFDTK